jgi:hypothetical protein
MPDDKEVKQREEDKERTKRERQEAVEEAAKSGFGTVYTDREQYPVTGDTRTGSSTTKPKDPKGNEPTKNPNP